MSSNGRILFGRWDYETKSGPEVPETRLEQSEKESVDQNDRTKGEEAPNAVRSDAIPVILHPGKIPKAGRKTPVVNPDACLSPYDVRYGSAEGPIAENWYQFSKVYENVPAVNEWGYVPGHQGRVCIWNHPAETHAFLVDGEWELTKAYWNWRKKGMNNPYAVRRPAGYTEPLFLAAMLGSSEFEDRNYLQGRETYIDTYRQGFAEGVPIREHPRFLELKRLHRLGQDLLLLEVDGPEADKKAGPPYSGMGNVLEVTREVYDQARWNPNRPFGHGWCVAALLLDWI